MESGTWRPVEVPARWRHAHYVIKERRLTLGRQYYVETPHGELVGYCAQKMFRLREDIRVYADKSKDQEVLVLRATKIMDFNANFEVVDPTTNEHLGFLRRKGWSSLVRDEWHVTDSQGRPVATLREDSLGMALLRRFVTNIIPSHYFVSIDAKGEQHHGATIDERFQFFGDTFDLKILDRDLDPRMMVALTVLMDSVEKAREQ